MADQVIAGYKIQIGLDSGKFETQGVRLQAQAKKITEAFNGISGLKADQKLQAVQTAVERLGGVANLSAPQVARLRKELDGLAAAGVKIPKTLELPKLSTTGVGAGIDQLKLQAQGLSSSLGPVGSALSALGPAGLAAAAGIGAISLGLGSVLSAAAEAGSRITDLSQRTGLSTDAVQSFGYAAEQTGGSVEGLAKASLILQKNIASGSSVFKQLGLDVIALKQLNPEEQFLAVAEAIRKIDDPAKQAQLAMLAFGKSGAELLPAIRAGFADLAAEARELGLVLDKDAVAAGDRFGDSMTRAGKAWDNLKAAVGGKIIGTLQLDVLINSFAQKVASANAASLLAGPAALFAGPRPTEDKEAQRLENQAVQKSSARRGGPDASLGLPGIDAQIKILGEGLPKATTAAKKALSEFDQQQEASKRKALEYADALKDAEAELNKIGSRKNEAFGQDLFTAGADKTLSSMLGDDSFGSVTVSAEDMAKAVTGVNTAIHDGELGIGKLKVATDQTAASTFNWSQTLQDVENAFSVLGISADSNLGQIIGGLTQAAAAGGAMKEALAPGASIQQKFAAGIQGATTAIDVFKKKSILGGIGKGAALGAAFGPQGAAIGAIAGGIVGLAGKLFGGESEAAKAAKIGGKVLGRSISEEMAKEVAARAKATGKSIEQVFKEIKVEELTAKFGELRGKAQEAVGQIGSGLSFFGKIKGAAAAQGRIFGTQFAAVVKSEGFDKALELFKATFANLPDEVKAAVPADVQKLFAFGENEQFASAVDAGSALAESFKGTTALIGASSQTMADFGEVAKATFDQAAAGAIEAGATQEEAQRAALQAVLPLLGQMQATAIQTGVALDANTQALIDQAKAAGIEIPVDPLLLVVDILKEISAVLQQIGGIEVTPKINVPTIPGVTTPGEGGSSEKGFNKGGLIRAHPRGTPALLHGLEAIIPLNRPDAARRVLSDVFRLRPGLITSSLASVLRPAAGPIPSFDAGGFFDGGGTSGGSDSFGGSGGVSISAPLSITVNVQATGDVGAIGDQVAAAIGQEYPRLLAELEQVVTRFSR